MHRNKVVAALLAIFLGGFGIHKFYLGRIAEGILHIIFMPLGSIIGLIEGISWLIMSQQEFDIRFNYLPYQYRHSLVEHQREQLDFSRKKMLERAKKEVREQEKKEKAQRRPINSAAADELAAWHDLLQKGIIEQWEYDLKKKEILG